MEGPRQCTTRVRCQRIGCNAMFSEDDNPEGSCQFHDAGPIFHDGTKEWSCCKKRSHDFSLFLEIPGCKQGKHTTEKPVLAKPAPKISVSQALTQATNSSSKDSCSRCRQGFFCSDHGAQAKEFNAKPVNTSTIPAAESNNTNDVGVSAPVKKIVDINEPQVCRNNGCGQTFKEKDNHEAACNYHPGPPVFRDRMRGWKCCDIHVKEFDEFMGIPPCTRGWHSADGTS